MEKHPDLIALKSSPGDKITGESLAICLIHNRIRQWGAEARGQKGVSRRGGRHEHPPDINNQVGIQSEIKC